MASPDICSAEGFLLVFVYRKNVSTTAVRRSYWSQRAVRGMPDMGAKAMTHHSATLDPYYRSPADERRAEAKDAQP